MPTAVWYVFTGLSLFVIGLIGKEFLSKAKRSLRVINVARGGIVDEEALADAIREGRIAGAALDVFAKEPTTESPLFELPQVVVAPHLGASTQEVWRNTRALYEAQCRKPLAKSTEVPLK